MSRQPATHRAARRINRNSIVLASAALAAMPALTSAATVTWNAPTPPPTATWSSPASWSGAGGSGIPVAGDAVNFTSVGAAATASAITNEVNQNFTIGTLNYLQRSDQGQFHNTSIDNGVTLTVSGGTSSVPVFDAGNTTGDDSGAGTQASITTFGGLGTLTVNNTASTFHVREGSATSTSALRSTLDLSNLANFNATVNDFAIGEGTSSGTAGGNRGTGTIFLAQNSNVTAANVNVGVQVASSGNQSQMFFGSNTALNAGTMTVGGRKGSGILAFTNGLTNGTLVIRGQAGGSTRANLNSAPRKPARAPRPAARASSI